MQNLILVHGALGSSNSWQHIVTHLEEHYYIHNINLPGHGASLEPMKETNLKYFSDYILNYTEGNRLNDYIMAGYSMGGYLGLYMAANHYKGLQKLYTIATKMLWDDAIANKEAMKLDYNTVSEKAPQFLTMQQNAHPNNWPYILSDTQNILQQIGQNPITTAHLNAIQIPVQMCVGNKDHMVTQEETLQAAAEILNSSYIILDEQPHIIEKMNGEIVAESIKKFAGL
ncbi:MAG: alpha/beta fold hydrolase [Bacteroidota bacterium]|nr:alpha/beta fold hydrolase [Bacteroidota bacterium]